MKRKFFAAFLSLCMVMSLVPMTVLAAENDGAGTPSTQLPDPVDGVITLETDTTLQSTTFINENTVLDLNGKTLTLNGEIGIVVNNNTNFTVCDSSVTQPPQVTDEYDVNYSSGKIQYNNSNCAIQVQNGANFVLESGTIYSEKGNGINVLAQTTPNEAELNSSATINGGYISAQEFGIGVYGRTAILNVNDGVIEARDNAVVAGNGSRKADYTPEGYVINVNGGTLIGKITTSEYASCGIYHPNAGTVNVTGGEIISTKGAGIVARAGQTNISGGRITALGDSNFTGRVGDSRVVVSTSGVVLDLAANYGGADIENGVATNADVYVSGEATISGTNSSIDVIDNEDSPGSGVIEQDNVIITGGTFTRLTNGQSSPDSSAGKFFPAGALLTQDTTTGKVIASEPEEGNPAVAEVNGVPYTSLQSAIDMARDGDTVTLLKDETLDATIKVDKTVTIDLNQHTVAGNAVRAFHVINGTMTLTGIGTVTSTTMQDPNSSVIRVGNNGTAGISPAGLVVGENVVIKAPGTYGISVFGNATEETLTVNGTVTATGPAPAISGNGMYDGTTITIGETANISASQSVAIYHPQVGTLTINGGSITGGIEAKSGTITIKGNPSISAVGEKNHTANGNGPSTTGYAIAIVDNSAYGNGATITINSGSYIGPVEYLKDGNGVDSGNKSGSITVCGGHFSAPVSKEYLANTINAELYSLRNTEAPYSYYPTVDAAQAAAQPGDIVTDLSQVSTGAQDVTVTFNYGNGTTIVQSVSSGATTILPTLNDRGYNHFVGWTDQAGKHYDGGETVTITADTTFTAQWSYIPPANPNYKITIGAMENGTVTANPTAAKAGATVTLTPVPDEGYALSTLTVTDRFGDAVRVTENADGTYTFTMPNGQVTVTATFVETEEPVAEPFIDVAEGDWFYDAVVYAYQNELMDGVGGNRFAPNSETTRAQLVTILYRLEGEPAVSGDLPFTDVEAGIWYTDAILWAAQNNIVNGVSDTEFAPGDDLTRQQLVTILYRYAESKGYDVSNSADLSGYPDAGQIQDYAQPAMAWAVAENIIQGMEDGTLKPAGNASRAQIATILMRFCEDVAQ